MLFNNLIRIGEKGMSYFVYSTPVITAASSGNSFISNDGSFYFSIGGLGFSKIDANTLEVLGVKNNNNSNTIGPNINTLSESATYGMVSTHIAASSYSVDAVNTDVNSLSCSYLSTLDAPGLGNVASALHFTEDVSGNLYLGSSYAIAKADSSGVTQWVLDNSNVANHKSYTVDSVGNVYIYALVTDTVLKPVVIKISSAGIIEWIKKITPSAGASTTPSSLRQNCIDLDSNGDVYVVSRFNSGTVISTIKINTLGVVQWQRNIAVANIGNNIPAVKVIGDNIFVLFRKSQNYTLVCYTNQGVLSWSRTISRLSFTTAQDTLSISATSSVPNTIGLVIPMQISISGTNHYSSFIAKLPDDGSLTGEYGDFSYAAASITDTAGTHAVADFTITYSSTYTLNSKTGTIPLMRSGSFESI